MVKTLRAVLALLTFAAGAAVPAFAQGRPDPASLLAAQTEAMGLLGAMEGVWRGPDWSILPGGEKHSVTQTERIGPFLDGAVKVIEGRGYEPDSRVSFNAFGTISYDPATKTYALHSHAMGRVGDFAFKPTPDGYTWEIPMGPGRTLRYTAVIRDGTLKEVGDVLEPGKEPFRNFEMVLKRVGDTTWPAAGAVPPN